jgi:two-component system chemotaxis response regulator CheB
MIIEKNIDKSIEPPEIIIAEAKMSERAATSIENVAEIGEKTLFSCPDCGGGLWSINNGTTKHFRCHIGHSYTKDDLLLKQTESVESTLWIAVRMMEERKVMLKRLAGENSARGLGNLSKTYHQQALELDKHIHQLKGVLLST